MTYPVIKLPVVSIGANVKILASKLVPIYVNFLDNYAFWDFKQGQSYTSKGDNSVVLSGVGLPTNFVSDGMEIDHKVGTYQSTGLMDTNFDAMTVFGVFKISDVSLLSSLGAGVFGNWHTSVANAGHALIARKDPDAEALYLQWLLVKNSANAVYTINTKGLDDGYIFYALSWDSVTGQVTRMLKQVSTNTNITQENVDYIRTSSRPLVIGSNLGYGDSGSTNKVIHPLFSVDDKFRDMQSLDVLYSDVQAYMLRQGITI